ncbi:Mitochondrial import receptor subunit TOM5-like [Spatholobus suberectus]|nr:Mitochondrial import receptor subunit TOM5-like [Spatholobus suberectus]
MADSIISIQYLKDFVNSQIYDDEKWAFNVKLLRAAGLFAGSIRAGREVLIVVVANQSCFLSMIPCCPVNNKGFKNTSLFL